MSKAHKYGFLVVSYSLAALGAWALWRSAGPLAIIGVCLLIWSSNLYDSTRDS
jgi:hypothetical protein